MVELDRRIERLCREAMAMRTFPGCVVGYVRGGRTQIWAAGRLTYEAAAPMVRTDTVYDVASVTKSVPTGLLAMKLVEDGRLGLDDRVVQHVPELEAGGRGEEVLVRQLLTYTVIFDIPEGLGGVARQTPERVLETVLKAPLVAAPGEQYRYTNAPAILLGMVVERVTGRKLDELAQDWLFDPLGMEWTTFWPQRSVDEVAPTELEADGEVRGVPHDEAARVLRQQGMVAGCAGLFSTAGDLLRVAAMLLGDGELEGRRYFQPETVRLMAENQLAAIGATAGLGWEISRPDVMGRAQRPGMLMKSGFTGCWIAVEPSRGAAVVHLSNRTYPKRPGREPIQAFWRELNEALFGV